MISRWTSDLSRNGDEERSLTILRTDDGVIQKTVGLASSPIACRRAATSWIARKSLSLNGRHCSATIQPLHDSTASRASRAIRRLGEIA